MALTPLKQKAWGWKIALKTMALAGGYPASSTGLTFVFMRKSVNESWLATTHYASTTHDSRKQLDIRSIHFRIWQAGNWATQYNVQGDPAACDAWLEYLHTTVIAAFDRDVWGHALKSVD